MPSTDGDGGGVRLSEPPAFLEAEMRSFESDASSVISISNTLKISDTDEELARADRSPDDTRKYCLPNTGKTRLDLRTKQPLDHPIYLPEERRPAPSTPRLRHMMSKDTDYGFPLASASTDNLHSSDAEWSRPTLSRSNSIYTLGRASLQGQLSQLTSIKLPDASSLAKRIASIPTSVEAAKALSDAAEQIRVWISKASDVLDGLNADDDVEWAAAGGREGIEDVEKAIRRFGGLVDVYLTSIDQLHARKDFETLSAEELNASVQQLENTVTNWNRVKSTLDGVKEQVEVAMEWEQLWNSLLGEVGQEMSGLNRLVFEMEEKRHRGGEGLLTSKDSIDLGELETIIEERPGQGTLAQSKHFSAPPIAQVTSPLQSPGPNAVKEDSSLLALFARMQPLRAALDFLPMRLSAFHARGRALFPSACKDLDQRRTQLEAQWTKLESDADFLRRELGEDRWILVFRNAGRQALKMCESITRSLNKLKEAVLAGEYLINASSFNSKVESYSAKKTHYGPAIGRVLTIVDRGVQERLTLNGEILRLQSDMRDRWTILQTEMEELDLMLEEVTVETRDTQLRDSVSTVLSSNRSAASSMLQTPGSSPASSVLGTSQNGSVRESRTPTPLASTKANSTGFNNKSRNTVRASLGSSIPRGIPRGMPYRYVSPVTARRSLSPSPLAPRTTSSLADRQQYNQDASRPPWSRSTRVENHDFLPLSALEPSPYAKPPLTKRTNFLRSTRTVSQPVTPKLPQSKSMNRIPSTPTSLPTSSSFHVLPTHTPTPPVPSSAPGNRPLRKSLLPIPTTTHYKHNNNSNSNNTTPSTIRSTGTPFSTRSTAPTPSLHRQRSRPSLRTPSSTISTPSVPRSASLASASASASTSAKSTRTMSTMHTPRSATATSQRSSRVVTPRPGDEPEDGNEADSERAWRNPGRAMMTISLQDHDRGKDERPRWRP